ncbi:hypothetical protein [Dactylococcopsis salina]|uniref:Uncharacterized protein n=1 Tax=Dactylococcopsis salina (strain PCC 8305) TaxID=13035 RepID=K9YRM5_DACS8|nr:hypothetical protein [Dactylococcopsis salina]AFZ49137.1 hypothetical protein Dacsa_0338 [Dactylococcopsis salina PCC 8305]
MSFSQYKNFGKTVRDFQIIYTEANFVQEIPLIIPNYFREDLNLMQSEGIVDNSEAAICENLIYPILKEVWKQYRHHFLLWSHQSLNYDETLSGFPEYILAKRSPLGKVVFDQPYLMLVEAKQDKFNEGWAQCLAEMITAQRLNQDSKLIIYGIVSNGKIWQFAKLAETTFTKNQNFYSIQELDQLFAIINYIFKQCETQLENFVY